MFRIEKPIPEIIHVKAETQYELTSAFMRLQEYYESPYINIRGQYFTLEEYMDAYAANKGNFTYCTDWNGFNVPGEVVFDFDVAFGDDRRDLLKKEETLLQLIEDNRTTPLFYVIGTHDENESPIEHEYAHAFWYLFPEYKEAMKKRLKNMPHHIKTQACAGLSQLGYTTGVMEDEVQAFMATSDLGYLGSRLNIDIKDRLVKVWINMFKMTFDIFKDRKFNGKPTD